MRLLGAGFLDVPLQTLDVLLLHDSYTSANKYVYAVAISGFNSNREQCGRIHGQFLHVARHDRLLLQDVQFADKSSEHRDADGYSHKRAVRAARAGRGGNTTEIRQTHRVSIADSFLIAPELKFTLCDSIVNLICSLGAIAISFSHAITSM